ncbi:hypothetical protein RFI_28678 [Reticulomyxa filosa]|uniref:XK-related protein n=1 Tax=Reticulomyxa filosa TaxID=46433 RepID=X6M5G2_RETFI|nr:hypothetical protein RFI_28678 [Reticulomyxa filosa]|eukprot:ETO08707.1 hypothetical protein RFI_28678 [Reticulomyxa filosa]
MVMKQYYDENEKVFFWVGVSNLIIAQLCYNFAFIIRYEGSSSCIRRLLIFTCLLPLSPLLSFAFYWASLPNNKLSILLKRIGLEPQEYNSKANASNSEEGLDLREWAVERFHKNLGFLLEAAVEAFPQSLIQMSALVYTSRANWVTLSSIFLSLISFATKSIVFCQSTSFWVFIYNWVSMFCDFVGIFVVVSWVFFLPSIHTEQTIQHTFFGRISVMGQVWLLKVVIFSIPSTLFFTITCSFALANDLYNGGIYRRTLCSFCQFCVVLLFYTLLAIIFFVCSFVVSLFVVEIPCFSLVVLLLHIVQKTRVQFPNSFFFKIK